MNTFYWFFVGIMFFSTIFLFYKKGWYPKSYSPWKLFGNIVSLAAIVGAGYGIYLLANYCTPTKSERLANSALKEQMKRKLAEGPEKRLAEINNESKKRPLTPAEENEIVKENKEAESILKEYSTKLKPPSPQKLVPVPVYKWVFEVKPEPEDIINARNNGVDQICYRENDVVNKPYFDGKEIRFKYKTSKEKVICAILDKKSPSESHFLGMVDLPDQTGKPKGRKLIIRLKETSTADKFEGLIETWDGENWYPQIPAFLKKVQVQ